jgi:ribosomal protein L12E/L44/L45/RPP1/RPP2
MVALQTWQTPGNSSSSSSKKGDHVCHQCGSICDSSVIRDLDISSIALNTGARCGRTGVQLTPCYGCGASYAVAWDTARELQARVRSSVLRAVDALATAVAMDLMDEAEEVHAPRDASALLLLQDEHVHQLLLLKIACCTQYMRRQQRKQAHNKQLQGGVVSSKGAAARVMRSSSSSSSCSPNAQQREQQLQQLVLQLQPYHEQLLQQLGLTVLWMEEEAFDDVWPSAAMQAMVAVTAVRCITDIQEELKAVAPAPAAAAAADKSAPQQSKSDDVAGKRDQPFKQQQQKGAPAGSSSQGCSSMAILSAAQPLLLVMQELLVLSAAAAAAQQPGQQPGQQQDDEDEEQQEMLHNCLQTMSALFDATKPNTAVVGNALLPPVLHLLAPAMLPSVYAQQQQQQRQRQQQQHGQWGSAGASSEPLPLQLQEMRMLHLIMSVVNAGETPLILHQAGDACFLSAPPTCVSLGSTSNAVVAYTSV